MKNPQDALPFLRAAQKLLRYGGYSASDEERMLACYFEVRNLGAVEITFGDELLADFDPKQAIASDIRLSLRHGFFLRVVAVTEASLKELCDYGLRRKLCIDAVDLRGSAPRKYRDYLEKRVGIDFSLVDTAWRILETLFLIRHCWAHSDGNIEEHQKTRIRTFSRETRLCELSNDETTATISPELIGQAAEHALTILLFIHEAIKKGT